MKVSDATYEMNRVAHSHRRIMTNPLGDVKLVPDLKYSDFGSLPSRNIVHNNSNVVVATDPNIGLVPTPSACFKFQSRAITSDSEYVLSSQIIVTVLAELRD